MKKQLLLAAFLMGSFITVKAQDVTSFEASEGFAAGDINGQNGWVSTSYTDEDENEFNITNQVVSDAYHSEGTFSFANTTEADFGPQDNPVIGGFKDIAVTTGVWQVAYDVYIVPEGDVADGNDYTFNLYSTATTNSGFTARVDFSFEGVVKIVDIVSGELDYAVTDFEWAGNTWYHVEISATADGVQYFINDELVYEGSVLNTGFATLAITVDNYGGTAYYDAVSVNEGVAGIDKNALTQFSVFPNPANDIVTIAAGDALVSNVSIVDINGRTVKSVKIGGVANAQINVSDLAKGVYVMTVSSDKGTTTQKLMKN